MFFSTTNSQNYEEPLRKIIFWSIPRSAYLSYFWKREINMNSTNINSKILIVDDEEKIRSIISAILKDEGYEIETARDGIEAIEKSKLFNPQVSIVDLQMPRMDGIETITKIKELLPYSLSIILTAHGSIESAVQAIKQGANDYLTKPFDNEQMLLVVKRAFEVYRLKQEIHDLREELHKKHGLENIIGESNLIKDVRKKIKQLSENDATVLIEGESGTGKELAAKAIHYESERRNFPLVIIDCTSIPANLFESTLYGHEKGAFTDAKEKRIGKFEEANGGTAFLDEISELPFEAQAKLLRVLQEKEFTRVGGNTNIKVDVRIIAATNQNIDQLVKEGKFREDLFFRLNVLNLHLPPLREHPEDINLYVNHFLKKYNETFKKQVVGITEEGLKTLKGYDWKGNIRELENVIQRAMLNSKGERIEIPDIEFLNKQAVKNSIQYDPEEGLENYIKILTEKTEKEIILRTLEEVGWNRTTAADRLKISRRTLFNKMQEYNINKTGG
jgi:two-component system response regulator AtoC